jgi:DedD protein
MAWGILGHVKERLTGAIILVALIVLLVPELLTGPIRMRSAPGAATAPAAPPVARAATADAPLRSYTLTLGAPPPPQAATPAATAPAQPAVSSRQGPPQSSPGNPAESPKEGTGESASEGADAGRSENREARPARPPADTAAKAHTAGRRAQSAGTAASLQDAKSPTHLATRDTRPPAASTGWVVQLGSFVSRQNADRLAHTLAGKGFHMSVSPARAGSRVLWRVRAGPARDRTGAQRLAARLRALGHRGELLPVK